MIWHSWVISDTGRRSSADPAACRCGTDGGVPETAARQEHRKRLQGQGTGCRGGNAAERFGGKEERNVRREDTQEVTGLVLQASNAGEYDRRLVLLTRERGKISGFARGARRPGNSMMAASSPFCFGTFRIAEGTGANLIVEAEIRNYFETLRGDMEAACYGMYFLEVMNYWTRENNDEATLLLLLYQSLRALEAGSIPNRLVRCVFELRTIVIEGEYPGLPQEAAFQDSTKYAVHHIATAPLGSLYTFAVREEVLRELERITAQLRERCMRHRFSSLEILETMGY
ncbi:MAG: DNA repair protein RecO [Eubacteriales bacterium]|nr:DNA repair protein RecO [Eubacteriales bacterium]